MMAHRRAFTLLELLVAVSITAVLATALIATAIGTLTIWQRSQGATEALSQAKVVFDLLERDFQAAYMRSDTDAMVAVDVVRDTATASAHGWFAGTTKPSTTASEVLVPSGSSPEISDARFGLGGCWLRFITTRIDSNETGRDRSSPSAVGYVVLRKRIGTDNSLVRYRLFRADVRQTSSTSGRAGTFQAGYSLTGSSYTTSSSTQADTGTITTPATADVLADNVIDFGVWLYSRNSSGDLQRVFPATSGSFQFRSSATGARVDVADVMVRVLTQEGARLINAIENGRTPRPTGLTDDEWWWSVALAHSDVFSRRIELKGGVR